MQIAPSLLAADFGRIDSEIEMLNNSKAEFAHLDIMDGVFVPNISYGFPVVNAIAKKCNKTLDAHLMIVDPDRYVERFAKEGVKYLSVHYEACTHLNRVIQHIKSLNMKAGVALNPHTPVSLLEDILPDLDFVLLMSVNPGFGGQSFIENTYNKLSRLKKMITERNLSTLIEIDGGVNFQNAPLLKKLGADILVAGSTVFKSKNPKVAIEEMLK
ncbi:MAG: ribulose-phosphate 3-epimerase [Bacteroidales bacterium]